MCALDIARPERLLSLVDSHLDKMQIETLAEQFGMALRQHRRAAGLTQEELAERAGISPRSISGLERGEGSTPRRDTLALIVRALGLSDADRAAFERLVVRAPRAIRLLSEDSRAQSSARYHALPRALTSFVGRETDLAEVGALIVKAPLVTLVGAGGVGKTRLARELVRAHANSYADGARLVELAELRDPRLVASAVAAGVGMHDEGAGRTVDGLSGYLRNKHLLLVLDNCEHLVSACADLLVTLLGHCPDVHVVATSREPLAINGELLWLVRPLQLPDLRVAQSTSEVANLAAVRLFVDRAAAVHAPFRLTDENAAAVARICVALDGIPLALELAAASTRLLSMDQLAHRLEHDPHLLSATNRDRSLRHRTIRAAIDWSHELLDSEEQILLRRVSVFAGGWTLDMAENVCAGRGMQHDAILDVLARLIDKSMVVVDVRSFAARYRLLEPIRQYAQERLEEAGETAEYSARHAVAVLSLVRDGEGNDGGPDEIGSLDRFELEHANLRVALRWTLSHDQTEQALRAASALFRFWERRGHFQEGCAWLEEALAQRTGDASVYRGPALNALAFLYWKSGDVERAQPIAEQGLAVNRAAGRTLGIAFALGNLGAIAYVRNDPGLGVELFEESLALARQVGYKPFTSVMLAFLAGSVLRLSGPCDARVNALLSESLELAEATGARYALGQALLTQGDLHWNLGDTPAAMRSWQRALEARSEIADRRGIASVLERLAWGLAAVEEFASAAWLFGATESQHRALGIRLRTDEEVDHMDLLGLTRDALGPAFDVPFTAGAAATLEQAAAMALDLIRTR